MDRWIFGHEDDGLGANLARIEDLQYHPRNITERTLAGLRARLKSVTAQLGQLSSGENPDKLLDEVLTIQGIIARLTSNQT